MKEFHFLRVSRQKKETLTMQLYMNASFNDLVLATPTHMGIFFKICALLGYGYQFSKF